MACLGDSNMGYREPNALIYQKLADCDAESHPYEYFGLPRQISASTTTKFDNLRIFLNIASDYLAKISPSS